MSKRIPSKDEALEALDFIVSVLKEHEKDLDRLINELGTITQRLGDTGELSGKVEKVEDRLSTLQGEVTNLITYLSNPHEAPAVAQSSQMTPEVIAENVQPSETRRAPMIFRCKQWEDFENLASQAQTLSFMFRETERSFQVDAAKDNQIITYSGEIPKYAPLLRAWLSQQLKVQNKKIVEGILALG